MNSNNVVFNKSQAVVFKKREKLGIKEVKDSEIKKFVMASVAQCGKVLSPV